MSGEGSGGPGTESGCHKTRCEISETRIIAIHFAADNIGLSFVQILLFWWAP